MNNSDKKRLIIALVSSIFLLVVFVTAGIFTYNSIKKSTDTQDTIVSTKTNIKDESISESIEIQNTPMPTAAPTPKPVYPIQGWVVSDDVNIRTSPSADSEIIAKAVDLKKISLTDKVYGQNDSYMWFEIEYEDIKGYIREDYVALKKPTFAESISKGIYVEDAIDGKLKYTQLVYVKDIAPDVLINLTLAYDDNFIGPKLYSKEVAMIQYKTGIMLNEASKLLALQGYQIMLWDGYRPYTASVKMFEYIGDPDMVADPKKGSRHNRGAAVDVTLYKNGKKITMPTDYRYLDVEHSAISSDMTDEERENYEVLADAMTKVGFTTYKNEWWHFGDPDYKEYPVMDFPLDMF